MIIVVEERCWVSAGISLCCTIDYCKTAQLCARILVPQHAASQCVRAFWWSNKRDANAQVHSGWAFGGKQMRARIVIPQPWAPKCVGAFPCRSFAYYKPILKNKTNRTLLLQRAQKMHFYAQETMEGRAKSPLFYYDNAIK